MTNTKKYLVMFAFVAILVTCSAQAALGATASTSASVQNELPTASAATLNSNSDITLTSNATTTVTATVTVSDNNGCEDITSVAGILYKTGVGYGAGNDQQNYYSVACVSNSTCIAGGFDLADTYTCSFDIYWFADPTDEQSQYSSDNWTFIAIPSDATGAGSNDTAIQEVNTLTSIGLVQANINFGMLLLGQNTTSTNQQMNVQNLGNEEVDLGISAYANVSEDGYCMTCDIGDLDVDIMEYSFSSFTYGAGTDMWDSETTEDIDLAQGDEGDPRPEDIIYFGLGLPLTGIKGACTGTVVISAITSGP